MNYWKKKIVLTGKPHERRHPLEDGGVRITTFVPMRFRKCGARTVVVGPEGVENPVVVNGGTPLITRTQDPALLKALGLGYYWQHLLDTGAVADTAEIAEREGLHRTIINDYLRLALLAPDIVDAAFNGTLPRTVSLLGLLRDGLPLCWEKQRQQILR